MNAIRALVFGLLPAVALAMVAAPAVRADDAPAKPAASARGQKMQKAVKDCLAKIGLSDDQKAAIDKLDKDTMAKRQAILQSDKSREQKKKELKELQKSHREAMDKILTKDQQKALRECLKHSRPKKDADGAGRRNKSGANASSPGEAPS